MLFDQFSDKIDYLFSNRLGGVSQKPFESFNLAFHVGDDEAKVRQNRNRLSQEFFGGAKIWAMSQVHSDRVCRIDDEIDTFECDALMTHEKQAVLMVMVADCIPILFFDAEHNVIAAVHAGRQGVFLNIAKKTFDAMHRAYGTKSEALYVMAGPSIGVCCYEVGADLARQAQSIGYEHAIKIQNGRYYLDIKAILRSQLLALNLKASQFEINALCTACNTQNYFSYRKEGKTGRFCGAIMLK